ncbi:MAG: cisd1 protein [Marteilia pararefringens]
MSSTMKRNSSLCKYLPPYFGSIVAISTGVGLGAYLLAKHYKRLKESSFCIFKFFCSNQNSCSDPSSCCRQATCSTKSNMVNQSVSKDKPKVVDMIEIGTDKKKVVLCRCWKSEKFPECDGTHLQHNEETGDNVGPAIVQVVPN